MRIIGSGNWGSPIPLKQVVKNVGEAVVRNVAAVVQGNQLKQEDKLIKARSEICFSCPYFVQKSNRCSKCGCYLSFKTWLKAEKCPINKW